MSADAEAPKPDRYSWPVADEEALEVMCARIARHLTRAGARVVGLLPTGRYLGEGSRGTPDMSPLLAALAGSLVRFVDQEVTVIDHWRTWTRVATPAAPGEAAPSRLREIRPRVVEVTPVAAADATAAAAALQNALRVLRRGDGWVLVHLGGYAAPGTAPSTLGLCDGVALVVAGRRTRIAAVNALAAHIPSAKRLGVILLGCQPAPEEVASMSTGRSPK